MCSNSSFHFYYNPSKLSLTERQSDRLRLYNLASVGEDREWLRDVLLSSGSESSSDEDSAEAKEMRIQRMLRERRHHNKYVKKYYKDPGVNINLYYTYLCFEYLIALNKNKNKN